MLVADPDVGPLVLRDVSREEVAELLDLRDIDLARATALVDVADSRDGDCGLAPEARIRVALLMHAIVRAAVVDPIPPRLAAEICSAYPPLETLIDPEQWPPSVVARIFDRVFAECRD